MHEVVIDHAGSMSSAALTERLMSELNDLSAQDQVVREIVWGDEDITASVEEFLAGAPRSEDGPLVIRSVAAAVLLEETVTASAAQLQEMSEIVGQVVHHLRCGSDDKAFAAMHNLFEGLQSIAPLLELLGNRGLADQAAVQSQNQLLESSLTGLQAAWQREDLTAIADLLKYELGPLLMQIHDNVASIAVDLVLARAGGRNGAGRNAGGRK